MVLGTAVSVGYTPGQCSSMLQHLPCGCAACTHRLREVTNAARSIRVLVAVFLFVAFSLHDLDLRPVGFHFIGDDHWQAGARTRSHFGTVRDDRHDTARIDRNKNMRIPYRSAWHS